MATTLLNSTTMAMDLAIHDVDFSGYSTLTDTPTSDVDDYNWNHWSPIVNWNEFHLHDHDHDLNLVMDDSFMHEADHFGSDHHASNSASTVEDIVDEEEEEEEELLPPAESGSEDDLKGLKLVHLLMAAAEALTGANKSRELARVILLRLRELASPSHATNMERLAAYFTEALRGLLDGAGAHNSLNSHNKLFNNHCHVIGGPHHYQNDQNDILAAFQLLQDMSPYVKFGHFTANQAILEAVAHERRVHIIDFDIMEGVQWASLMQALANNGPGPGPHLRITALTRTGSGKRSIASVHETGRRLTAFAASVNQPFSFHQCRLDADETFRTEAVKLVRGEAVVFNCMLNLPHLSYRSPESVASFLNGAKALKARLVTVVEDEVEPVSGGFVGKFMDSLHHYSAVFDSLEAGFPMQRRARELVEKVFFGPRIVGSLGRIYRTGDEKEERGSWGEWLGAAGFMGVPVSFANHTQAKLLLGLFNDGYTVNHENGSNKLVLDWRSRRLLSASIWRTTCSSSDSD